MIKRIANNIEILGDIKIDFFLDENDNRIEYQYKEVLVKCDEYILETFRVSTDITTTEQFSNTTGIRLGISTWICQEETK